MKRLLLTLTSLVLTVILIAPAAIFADEAENTVSFGADEHRVSATVKMLSALREKPYETEVTLDYSWFTGNASDFNYELALFASKTAVVSGNATATPGDDKASEIARTEYIAEFYETFGFEDVEYFGYDKPSDDPSDSVAFSIAKKTVDVGGETLTLLFVPVRGIGYGNEWASNFRVGPLNERGEHYGFSQSAAAVYDAIRDYTAENDVDTSEVKLLLTGVSRAGAVSNLCAAMLDRDGDFYYDNIFTYTFSTPCTVTADREDAVAAVMYANIFNIIDPADFVTEIPLSSWGFTRYGRDIYLPNYYTDGDYAAHAKKAEAPLSFYAGGALTKEAVASLSGFPQVARAKNLMVEILLESAVPTYDAYYGGGGEDALQSAAVGAFVSGGTINEAMLSVFTGDLTGLYTKYTSLEGDDGALLRKYLTINIASMSGDMPYVALHHCQETVISFLEASAELDYGYADQPYTKYTVSIKSANAALSVTDENGNAVPVWGDRSFVQPSDKALLIAATDKNGESAGKITVKAEYYTGDGLPIKTSSLTADKIKASEEALTDADTGAEGKTSRAADRFTVVARCGKGGSVSGTTIADKGDKVSVTAETDEGYDFAGWYRNGKFISAKTKYTIKANSNAVYTAVFEPDGASPEE